MMITGGTSVPWDKERWFTLARAVSPHEVFLQVREPQLSGLKLFRLVNAIVDSTPENGRVIVNDRIDVAMASNAHGVHLKHSSLSPSVARRLLPNQFISSVLHHTERTSQVSPDLSACLVSPVFSTPSKPDVAPVGTEKLATLTSMIRESAPNCKVFALGGIQENTWKKALPHCDGVASIRWAWTTPLQNLIDFVTVHASPM